MKPYPKTYNLFTRDLHPGSPNRGKLIEGEYAREEFRYLRNNEWLFQEKVDGTNIRVHWFPFEAGIDNDEEYPGFVAFQGRSDKAQVPTFLVERLEELFPSQRFVDAELPALTLYGEGYGNRIQKIGKQYIPDGVNFVLFDVKVGDWWLKTGDVLDCAVKLGIQSAPFVSAGTLAEAVNIVRKPFESRLVPGVQAEGLIVRPAIRLFTGPGGHPIKGKIKTKDFQ